MEKGVYKYYQELPSWAKGAVAIAIIGGIGLIGYTIYKKVKTIQDKKESNETANAAEDEYLRLKKQGQKLSSPEANYFAAANAVKNALDGCDSVASEVDAINAVLKVVKKPIDWYYLVNVFGSRKIEGCAWGENKMYALPELLSEQLGHLTPLSLMTKTGYMYLQKELVKRGINI